jgi:hypothetical protein
MLTEERAGSTAEPTLRDLSEALVAVYGTDYGVHSPTWISRFTDTTRQAAAYRERKVLLAGDAAHVHSPPPGGRPRAAHHDGAGVALLRDDDRIRALGETIAPLLSMDEPRKRFAGMISGLDIHYDLGEGRPLLGRRMPDLDLATADGPVRMFTLLHDARPVRLGLGEPGGLDAGRWADRVTLVGAECAGPWELPVLGEVTAPTAVLVRPDGHVAWVGEGTADGLHDALTAWFGSPVAA